jgi:hypothetical protein
MLQEHMDALSMAQRELSEALSERDELILERDELRAERNADRSAAITATKVTRISREQLHESEAELGRVEAKNNRLGDALRMAVEALDLLIDNQTDEEWYLGCNKGRAALTAAKSATHSES